MLLARGDDTAPRTDGDPPVAEQAAGIDNGRSLLSEPGDRWTVTADDLLAGGMLSQVRYDGDSIVSVFTVGDVVVVDATTDDESVLAGLDSATGTTLWTIPGEAYSSSCFPVFADTRLLCNDVEAGTWSVYDADTGEVLKTQQSGYVMAVASSRSTAYLVHSLDDADGDDFNYDLGVEAIDAASFGTQWSQVLPDEVDTTDDPNAYDGGVLLDLEGSQLLVDYGPQGWGLDPRNGTITDTVQDYGGIDRGGYRVESTYDDVTEESGTAVTDTFGNTILSVSGDVWRAPDYRSVVDGRVGAGDTLYDLASGAPLWSRDDLYVEDENGFSNTWRWSSDPDIVLADDAYDEFSGSSGGDTLLDAATGDTLFYSDTQLYSDNSVITEDAVAVGDEFGQLQVLSRETGESAWDEDLSDLTLTEEGDAYWSGMVSTDSALVVMGADAIVGFTDFGPAPDDLAGSSEDSGSDDDDSDGDDSDGDDGGTSYATDCGSEPTFTPAESEAAYGGVTITFTVSAVCPGGQWLSSSAQTISMTADTDLGAQLYASGLFDFSDSPVWVPDDSEEPVTVPLTFPADGTYATPEEINDAIASQVIHVDCIHDPDAYAGPVPSDPADGADPSTPVPADYSGQDAATAEESALAALQRIAAQDDAYLATTFEGLWVPQLSSKVQGTTDDGIVYSYTDILAEHLRLRLRYPDVRLAQSSAWKSFLVPGYWVTLVGLTSTRPGPALTFCADSGFTIDHCYAKRVLRDGPADGSTKHRD